MNLRYIFIKFFRFIGLLPKNVVYVTTLSGRTDVYDDNNRFVHSVYHSYVLTIQDGIRCCKINGREGAKELGIYVRVIKPWLQGADTLNHYLTLKGRPIPKVLEEDAGVK